MAKVQMNSLTCFKCCQDTAKITYEENRLYKVTCKCGYEYTFNHCSMYDAVSYHNKMIELNEVIERNRQLHKLIKYLDEDRTVTCNVCVNYMSCIKNKVEKNDFSVLELCHRFKWWRADRLKALGIE